MLRSLTLTLLIASLLVACGKREPEVRLDTPEDAARSVGRVLCAEHQERIEAIRERLDNAQAIQAAKDQLLTASARLGPINERLEQFAEFFERHYSALHRCEVVLVDKMISKKDGKVDLAIELHMKDWESVDDRGQLELVDRTFPLVLTLVEFDSEWRVTSSSREISLPGGALQSLLD